MPSGSSSTVRGLTIMVALMTMVVGCGPRIEEEPPIPEHRVEPSETWCALMLDPVCPAQQIGAETEAECFEIIARDDVFWGRTEEGEDECAEIYASYIECLAMLPCDELQQHFVLTEVPTVERSSCGGLLRAQLDCQRPFQ